MSQLGVPYSWGGGNAAGKSTGIDSGSGTVGFDCSGLMLYAFAGVGIKLDHYTGSQYNAGRKIPSCAGAPWRHALLGAQRQPARGAVSR